MDNCEIYHVAYKHSFAWKWRRIGDDGRIKESKEMYALYYECVCAARENGYEPVDLARAREKAAGMP